MKKENLGLSKKIIILSVVIGLLMFFTSISFAVVQIKKSLTVAAEGKIDEITELAYNVIDGYKLRADKGEFPVEVAKELALKDLAKFHYQGFNYVWVNDYNNEFLVHPTKARGVDISNVADIHGKKFFLELSDMARKGEKGYVSYTWTKPGDSTNKQFPKLSTSKSYPEWGWVVATGVYIDEIDNLVVATFWRIFAINLVALAAIITIIYFLFIKKLVSSMNLISEDLRNTSGHVSQASEHLEITSQRLAEGGSEQAAAIQETSATLEETSSMVHKNNENTRQAAILAKQSKEHADRGNEEMAKMMKSVEKMASSSHEISKIIKVIDEIAFQTNLLALNAAVEAARAGDAGKGFAVVAEEVRNLAQRSAQAAKETAELIETNLSLSEEGAGIAQNVSASIQEIDAQTKKVSDLINEIATATNEQAVGVEQIFKAITQMELVIQSNASTADESASASEELLAQAHSMNEIVDKLAELVNGYYQRDNAQYNQRPQALAGSEQRLLSSSSQRRDW